MEYDFLNIDGCGCDESVVVISQLWQLVLRLLVQRAKFCSWPFCASYVVD